MSNKEQKTLVTSGINHDLDGLASAWAYAELLCQQGHKAVAGILGKPHPEANFVLKKLGIKKVNDVKDIIKDCNDIVLVDSDLGGITGILDPLKIVEVIDHRSTHQAGDFPRAKTQVELVGAAATLVAERFYQQKVKISPESALLLFSAIVSNTINFQAKVTTDRDRKMADWLHKEIEVPEDYVYQMFVTKSKFKGSLKEFLTSECKVSTFGGKTIDIFQLEIVEVAKFIKDKRQELINILTEYKNKESLDFVFLTCIDIAKGFNMFVVVDDNSQQLVSEVLKVKFKDKVAKLDEVIMRKEIVPRIKEYLEGK